MRPLYMLTCICRGQHAAVFGICTETVYIQESTCAHGACTCMHTLPVSGEGGGEGGGGGGGTGNPKADR